MLYSILKGCLACLVILSVAACEKNITEEEPLIGVWHFTKWESGESSLLEEDVPPLSRIDTIPQPRTSRVRLVFRPGLTRGMRSYEMLGHVGSQEYDGFYKITNKGSWTARNSEWMNLRMQQYFDPWMEKLSEALTAAHSYELRGDELIIYDDNQRVFLHKE